MNDNNFSDLFQKFNIDPNNISPEMLNNLMGIINSNSEHHEEETNSHVENSSIDFETIMKIKTLIDKMNSSQNDARSNLLLSLKPYLKDSRKNKIDQYIQLLNMSKLIDIFPFMEGRK